MSVSWSLKTHIVTTETEHWTLLSSQMSWHLFGFNSAMNLIGPFGPFIFSVVSYVSSFPSTSWPFKLCVCFSKMWLFSMYTLKFPVVLIIWVNLLSEKKNPTFFLHVFGCDRGKAKASHTTIDLRVKIKSNNNEIPSIGTEKKKRKQSYRNNWKCVYVQFGNVTFDVHFSDAFMFASSFHFSSFLVNRVSWLFDS